MVKRFVIAYLTPHISSDPNSTEYQRSKHLGLENNLLIFTGRETTLPKELERNVKIIKGSFLFGRIRALYSMWCVWKVLMLHRKFRFDLVYSTPNCFSLAPAAILKVLGFRWVADIWDHPELLLELLRERKKNIKAIVSLFIPRFIGTQIAKRRLKHADLVISAIHPSALAKFGISPQKIFEVTNGVDLSITKPKALKRSNGQFKVFYVGFLTKGRGLDLMLHAIAMLKGKIKGLRLILVGDARREDVAYLDRTVKKLGLEDEVDFLGRLNHENVLALMEVSHACLFPFPRLEVLDCIYPIKILEYMAMGKAIVATRLKGISAIIKDGATGLLIEPDDPRNMADAIFRIYENPDLRRRLEANAKKDIEKYDWKIINGKINEKLAECFE